jgi:hypothetical protein
MVNMQSTQTILSNKGQTIFTRFVEKFESVKELMGQLGLPYQTAISQEISEIERPLFGTGASALSVPQVDAKYLRQLGLLQQWYVFRGERTGILRFFEKYPFLVSLLVEIYPHIREFFPYSLVYLTVATDPEEWGIDRLIAFIATDLGPDDALDALSAFDKKWWLNSLKQAQGKLCITLEFQ